MSLTRDLLLRKNSPQLDIEIHLFENCNLQCAFCCQDHNDNGWDQKLIDKKLQVAFNFIDKNRDKKQPFTICLMGGELFQDKFNQNQYDKYVWFYSKLKEKIDSVEGEMIPFITTNMTFNNDTRSNINYLIDQLKNINIDIRFRTSFDFIGRTWSPVEKEYFESNIFYYKDRLRGTATVLHKPNIEFLLSEKKDPLFEKIYENFEVSFEFYMPDKRAPHIYLPSDDDLRKGLIYLAKNYPKCEPIVSWVNEDFNTIHCCSEGRIIIPVNGVVSNCLYLDYDPDKTNADLTVDHSTVENMAERWFEDQGCLSCKHFNRCGWYCWPAIEWKTREKSKTCFMEDFFNEILEEAK